MKRLQVFNIINDAKRISSVDIYRCIAIISVVVFHFNRNYIPFGFLGVDLFFVISGLLVGGLLTKEFQKDNTINFLKFVLQRGFKIWPSYYFYLLTGSLIAILLYQQTNPEEIIPLWDLKRYLFFYLNYIIRPFHWSFDHLWTLCVEEHFYILLPIMFLITRYVIKPKNRTKSLFLFVVLTIVAGILFKCYSFYRNNNIYIFSQTHHRIDALAWGVLLNLIVTYYKEKIKHFTFSLISFISGLLIFSISVYIYFYHKTLLFDNVTFKAIIPFSFFLMLLGTYYVNFSVLKPFRFIAYFSYNWYLWHTLLIIFITKHLGNNVIGLVVFLIITFSIAMVTTVLIEETFLNKRKMIIGKIFNT